MDGPSPTPARPARALAEHAALVLLAAVVLAWGASLGFGKIESYDYWWHLETGERIVETGRVPTADPYSYTRPGARWIDVHWLFQVGLQGLHAAGGHEAVRLAKGFAVLGLLAAIVAVGGVRGRAALAGLAVAGVALTGASRFLVRPDLLSFLLLVALLGLLYRHERRGDAAVFAVVPLQLVWANLHGLFAVGLALCAMALAAEGLRPLWPGAPLRPRAAAYLALVLALATAACALNPNGLDGLLFPVEQLAMISEETRGTVWSAIQELRPSLALPLVQLAPPALLALLAAGGLYAAGRRASALDALILVGFGYLALAAQRNLALFAVAVAPGLIRNLGRAWEHRLAPGRRAALGLPLLALLAAGGVLFGSERLSQAWSRQAGTAAALTPLQYPEAAVRWIERERPPGPIYHRMGDGGYLIARLFPDYRVMVDGRLEVYGPELFARLELLNAGTPRAFRRLHERYGFGTALLHHALLPDHRLLAWLWREPGWRLVHLDEVAAVFVRGDAEGASAWPEVDPDSEALFPPLAPEDPPALDLWRRRSRIGILIALGRYERALRLADATLEQHDSARVRSLRRWLRERAPAERREPSGRQ